MMKRNVFFTLLMAGATAFSPLLAQRWQAAPPQRADTALSLGLSTYVKGTSGGLKASLLAPLRVKSFTRVRAGGKTRSFTRLRGLELFAAGYYHPRFHSNLILGGGYLLRRTKAGGFYVEALPGLGLSRTFVDGVTYVPGSKGELQPRALNGNWYLAPSLALGIGKDLHFARRSRPWAFGGRFNLTALYPYQANALPLPILELGLARSLSLRSPWRVTRISLTR